VFDPPYGFADAVAVNADVGLVKLPVYTASPFIQRKFVNVPTKLAPVDLVVSFPIVSAVFIVVMLLLSVTWLPN